MQNRQDRQSFFPVPLPTRVQMTHYALSGDFPALLCGDGNQFIGDQPAAFLDVHKLLEIGICCAGSGLFVVNEHIFTFTEGDAYLIFKNQLHMAQGAKSRACVLKYAVLDMERLLASLSTSDFREVMQISAGEDSFPNIIKSVQHPALHALIAEIIHELETRGDNYQSIVKALAWTLAVKIKRAMSGTAMSGCPQKKEGLLRIRPALDYILHHYMEPLSIKEMADSCLLGENNFRRVFRQCMGIPPQEYLMGIRVKMAAAMLLQTDASILDVSLDVGFPTQSSFNRNFRRMMGGSPGQFRRNIYHHPL